MPHTVARYTVKEGSEETNAELVRAVYRELEASAPEGFTYATYQLDDGRTFVHVAEYSGEGAPPLTELDAFKEFQRELHERCEWGPEVGPAELVGRYGG